MKADIAAVPDAQQTPEDFPQPKRLALIVSKGTLDQAYPPLVMATTAASRVGRWRFSSPSTASTSSTKTGCRSCRSPRGQPGHAASDEEGPGPHPHLWWARFAG